MFWSFLVRTQFEFLVLLIGFLLIFSFLFHYFGIIPRSSFRESNLIQKSVFLNQYFYSNSIVESHRNVFIDGENQIQDSEFILCCSSYDGGAIYTTESLSLTNCLFSSNSGSKGGCIYCKSYISCVQSSFISSYAEYGAGIFSPSYNDSVSVIKQVSFTTMQAISYGCMYRESIGNSTIRFNNVTYCSVDNKVAGFSIIKSPVGVLYMRCLELLGYSDVSFLLDGCTKCGLKFCVFWGSQTAFTEQGTSLAVHFTNSYEICSISQSFFAPLYMNPNTYAFKATNRAKIILDHCCLTSSAEDSLFGDIQYGDSTSFSAKCQNIFSHKANTLIGYHSFDIEKKKAIYFSNIQDIFIIVITFTLTFSAGCITAFWLLNTTYSIINSFSQILKGKW